MNRIECEHTVVHHRFSNVFFFLHKCINKVSIIEKKQRVYDEMIWNRISSACMNYYYKTVKWMIAIAITTFQGFIFKFKCHLDEFESNFEPFTQSVMSILSLVIIINS